MSIQSFVKPGEFEPEAIAVMSEAFDAACKALNDTGQPESVLEVMAERIMHRQDLVSAIRFACGKPRYLGLPANEISPQMPSPLASAGLWRGYRR
jgi:hypothetical protein